MMVNDTIVMCPANSVTTRNGPTACGEFPSGHQFCQIFVPFRGTKVAQNASSCSSEAF